ncbi:MAG: hypothetical protein GY909_10185 [Oligoflexia bacterium]|nr:hypothetical protein [Oligoflexia bacterium]
MEKSKANKIQNIKKATFWLAILICTTLFSVDHLKKRDKFWASQRHIEDPTRSPAQIDSVLSKIVVKNVEDYFIYETYQKFLEFDLEIQVRTNKKKDYYQRKTKLAIHHALAKTFADVGVEGNTKAFTQLVKENLISSFVKHFVKTIRIFQIMSGEFQIDLNFIPRAEKQLNYNSQLKTNQLISYDRVNELSLFLNEEEKRLDQKILSFEIPPSTKTFQYKGGQISIWLKLLDMDFDFDNPIPNPKKNAIKGFVRYRKYYRANNLNAIFPNLKGEYHQLTEVHFKKMENFSDSMVTLDHYKSFNLGNMIPQNDSLEIYFGKMKADNFYREGFFGKIFGKKHKDVDTAELFINGKAKYKGKEKEIKVSLRKLVYDFKTEKFRNKSRLNVRMKGDINGIKKNELLSKIKSNLIVENPYEMIKGLHLDTIIDFTQGKEEEQ